MTKTKTIAFVVLGIVIIGAIAICVFKGPFGSSEAEKYYKESGEVLSKVNVESSKTLETETEIISDMRERGFEECPVTYNYSLDGEFNKETEVSESSEEKHPIYDTVYMDGEQMWIVTTTNGTVTAYPLFHPRNSDGIEILYSETASINCYDAEKGVFFETIPDKAALDLRTVESIDAKTLSELTEEVANE